MKDKTSRRFVQHLVSLLLGTTLVRVCAGAPVDTDDLDIDRFPVDLSSSTNWSGATSTQRPLEGFNNDRETLQDETSKRSNVTTLTNDTPVWPSLTISPFLFSTIPQQFELGNSSGDDDVRQDSKLATNSGNIFALTPTELPSLRFDPYVQMHAYRSDASLSFDDRGMWMFYDATNWLLDKLQPDPFPDYLLTDEDLQTFGQILLALKRNYAQWLKYEEGFIIAAALCFLLTTIFTLCYLVYACCRCCCPQSPSEKTDKKRDSCKRHCANIVLGALTIFMTFAVACSFITNHYVHVAAEKLPNNLRTSVDDVALYRDDTDQRIQKLLVQDFRLLNSTIAGALDASSHVVIERVKEVTGAISLDHLATIADRAQTISNNLSRVEDSLSSIRQDALKMRANLTRLSDWASGELRACLNNGFDEVSDHRQDCESALDVLESYKDLPETLDYGQSFSAVKDQLRRLAAYNLSTLLQEPRSQFETLKLRFHQKISAAKHVVGQKTSELSSDLMSIATNISRRLQRIDVSHVKSVLDTYESELAPYEQYRRLIVAMFLFSSPSWVICPGIHKRRRYPSNRRWIGAHVISGVLGVMVICFGLGLFFGVCGRRPSYYDDDCCIWSRGGKLYCSGIFFGVLCSFVFMVIVIGLFFAGANSQVVVCKSLKYPSSQNGFMNVVRRYSNMLSDHIASVGGNPDLQDILAGNTLSKIITGCSENQTLYRILDFDRRYKLTNLKEVKAEAFRQLDSYVQQLQDVDLETALVRLIPPEAESILREIEHHNVTPLPAGVIDELFVNATVVLDFAEKINTLKKIRNAKSTPEQGDELQRVLRTILPELEQMKVAAESLRHRLIFVAENLTLLNDQIPQLTKEVPNWVLIAKNAQGLLASNLTGYARAVAADVVKSLQAFVDEYLQHVASQLDTEISSCEPLVRAVDAVYVSICHHVLQPFNAFWSSVAIFLLLSIPAVALAAVLRDLYVNTDAYVARSCSSELVPFLSDGTMESSARRNGPVAAYTTDCYDHYTRVNGTAQPKRNRTANGSTNWRTPSSENVGSPPPPYQSPKRRRR